MAESSDQKMKTMKRNSAITEEDADELKDEFASFVERIRKFTPAASISDDPYEINTKKKYQKMMGGTIGRWQEKQQAETAQLLWGDEAEKADFTKRLQEFQDSDPNDENFRIPPLLFTKIKNIVENPEIRRYTTVDEFMSDALELFTTWWTTPQKSAELMTAMWPDMTMQMKHEVKEKAPQFYEQMEAANQPKNLTTLQPNENAQQGAKWKKITVNADVKGNGGSVTKILDHQILNRVDSTMDHLKRLGDTDSHFPLQISKERLKYDGYPLVWEFYTRFFPAKIALIALGHMVSSAIDDADKILDQFVDFEEFQSRTYNLAVGLSQHIREFETYNRVPRNGRFSTGLPLPKDETVSVHANEEEQLIHWKKVESSKKRFTSQYLGRDNKKDFSGMLNAAGLAQFRKEGERVKIGLTDMGLKFYLLENPLITEYIEWDAEPKHMAERKPVPSLSHDEQKFVLTDVIPQFPLECLVINEIAKNMKEKDVFDTKTIDAKINVAFSYWIKARPDEAKHYKISAIDSKLILVTRIATMGRLAELGFVNWRIEKGASLYTPGKNFKSLYSAFKRSAKLQLPEDLSPLLK